MREWQEKTSVTRLAKILPLGKTSKVYFWQVCLVLGKILNLLCLIFNVLGQISLLTMAKYWIIIHPSGHTGLLLPLSHLRLECGHRSSSSSSSGPNSIWNAIFNQIFKKVDFTSLRWIFNQYSFYFRWNVIIGFNQISKLFSRIALIITNLKKTYCLNCSAPFSVTRCWN